MCPEMYFCTNRQFIMAHQYYFSFDMITLLQPNTSLFSSVADILFIYFNFILVQLFLGSFFSLQGISKYTTVLLNKFIYKVHGRVDLLL